MRILTHRKTRGKKNVTRHERNAERITTSITKGDTVRVMRGVMRGEEGKITMIDLKAGRVSIENGSRTADGRAKNMNLKHRRARRPEEQSGIIEMPRTIAVSNVMLLDPKSGEPTRIKTRVERDPATKKRKTERLSVKSGEPIRHSR
jgi:large subunit ribosomal protein L24